MRRILLIALIAGTTACTFTPTELRQTGDKHTYRSERSPRDAAQCLARNAEAYEPAERKLHGEWRDGLSAGSVEVLVRSTVTTFVVADVSPMGTGSAITVWQNPVMVYQDLHAMMIKGC